jgi:polysaccharide export outer membrane protein
MQRPLLILACLAVSASLCAQEPYRISPGDGLNIEVSRHPEYSLQVTVRPDGRITHPITGEIEVAGKTLQELTDILTAALSKVLQAPNVVINVATRKPRLVYVLGEVLRAGPQEVDAEGVTVKEAIVEAGGLPRTADTSKAELHRAKQPPVTIDLDKEMQAGADEATRLYEDDALIVQPLLEGYVGVVGTAGPAGRIPFEVGDTLLTVLSRAGGAPETADLQNSLILREAGTREEVDLEAIQEGRWEGDLPKVGPGDFIILPVLPPQQFVTILGQVAGPKRLPVDRKVGLKLSEVLTVCSPFPETADAHNARIIHADGSVTQMDFKDLVDGKGDQSLLDMQMQPEDVVLVPRQFAKVAALGEFPRSGVFVLERGDRILDLVVKAGGFTARRGEKRFALLIRRPENADSPEAQKIDLTALIDGRAEEQNVELQTEDILYLPGPKIKWYEAVSQVLSPVYSFQNLRNLLFGGYRTGLF